MFSRRDMRGARDEDEQGSPVQTMTEDVRQQLYGSLRKHGLIDKMKSEMRHRLIMELTSKRILERPMPAAEGARSLALRAGDSLVADYLSRRSLEYTLSVFVPEAGLSRQKLLSSGELLDLLHINPHSTFHKALSQALKAPDGFLWTFVRLLAEREASGRADSGVQTGEPRGSSLHQRLAHIDRRYEEARGAEAAVGVVACEERLQSFQRDLEERTRAAVAAEKERWRAGELARMRQEERERGRLEWEEKRRCLEAEHAERLRAVQERERSAAEQWRRQQEQWDREAHARRQALLEEMDALRHRENGVRREQEAGERERREQRGRAKAAEEAVRLREQHVREQEASLEGRLAEERATIRLTEERRLMERWRDLEAMDVRTKEEARLLEGEKEGVRHLREEVLKRQALFDEMEVVDYPTLKQENAALRSQMEALRTRLTEISHSHERQRHSARDSAQANAEKDMERQIARLEEDLRHERSLLKQAQHNSQLNLHKEMTEHQQLLQRYEAQSLQVKEMHQEIGDLRQQLQQTEHALNNELHRRPRMTPRTPRGDLSSRFGDAEDLPPFSSRSFVTPRWAKAGEDAEGAGAAIEEMEDVVAETKWRLRALDQETENLQSAYRTFQHRLNNPVYGVAPLAADEAVLRPRGPPPAFERAAHSPDQRFVPTSSAGARADLQIDGHRYRSGSPRVVILDGPSDVSGLGTGPELKVNAGLDPALHVIGGFEETHSPAVTFGMPGADTSRDVGSTGDQFGPVASGEAHEATTGQSLDESWRSGGAELVHEVEEEEEEEESDKEWEARRQRRAEERARREEEEWNAQQRELAELRQSGPQPAERKPKEVKEEEKEEEEEEVAAPPPEPGIDPIMQKYMEMVRQRRAEEAAEKPPAAAAAPEPVPDFDFEDEPPSDSGPRSAPRSEDSRSDFW